MPKNSCIMQIWAESGKSALPICNYSQILYQFLTFTQNLKRSHKISIWIIPNSLEFRRIFNAIRSKLIIFANCRPWYIFHTSIRFCNGSVICGKRNQFILLIKGKDTACRLSFVTDCCPYFKLTFFIISPIPLQILSAVLNGSQKILQIRQVVQK